MSGTCTSKTLMGIAGANADGVYSFTNLKDPLNPDWDNDPAMMEYREKVAQYQPEADLDNGIVGLRLDAGRTAGRGAGGRRGPHPPGGHGVGAATSTATDAGLLLPGVTVTTGEDDNFMGESFNVMQYEFTAPDVKNHFVLVGDLVDVEGQTVDLTPEELINS